LTLLAGCVADERRAAARAVGVHAQQRADARGVELQLLDLRLCRHQVTRHQDILLEVAKRHLDLLLADGDDGSLVLGLALLWSTTLPFLLPGFIGQ